MTWSIEDETQDKEKGVDHEINTMTQFARMASDQVQCLNFTFDTPRMNGNLRMPVLDTEIWVGREAREVGIPPEILTKEQRSAKMGKLRNVILYSFYKKPMSNKVPNRESSAEPINQKIATCSQEVVRRMKNTSRDLHPSNIEEILKVYMDELISGGYDQAFRERILEAGTKGFVKMWEQERQGISRINRPEKSTRRSRRWNKLCGKTSWYKGKGETPQNSDVRNKRKKTNNRAQVEGVLYVPFTKKSELKRRIQKIQDKAIEGKKTGRLRILERLGNSIKDEISNPTPWRNSHCGRQECPTCRSQEGACKSRNAVSRTECDQ